MRASSFTLSVALPVLLATSFARSSETTEKELVWHEVNALGIEGQGWPASDLAAPFDRLPAKAEGIVPPPVWRLSRHSAGLLFRFNTDATTIEFKYEVLDKELGMTNQPATGKSGIDIYAFDDGVWKWVDVSRPATTQITHTLKGLDPGLRSYLVYLPLYNTTFSAEIGVPAEATIEPVAPREDAPIVFYGTSITHGASASRPGMTHAAILGRRLNMPVINLGFSGNGRMEPEMGALIAEIDASVYVIDCLPNMNGKMVIERAEPLVRRIREIRPDTPIILVEDRTYANAWIFKSRREKHRENRASLIRAFDNLVSDGVKHLYYLEGEALLGDDTEATTDGSHPSDLGFVRQADAFEPILNKALGR
ncbi:MAG: SGNH/GDSL hydrolase family protein [Verrucomicrobiales bacterium]|nr:SGNH/GDSL hydrolase family protein [Verrucomicrobiales bacterium]